MPAMMPLVSAFQDVPMISLDQAAHNVMQTAGVASMRGLTSATLVV